MQYICKCTSVSNSVYGELRNIGKILNSILDCSIADSIWFSRYHKGNLLFTGKLEMISVGFFTGVCNIFFAQIASK